MNSSRDRALENIADWQMFEKATATKVEAPAEKADERVTAVPASFASFEIAIAFDSYEAARDALSTEVQEQYGSDRNYCWLADFGDDWLIYQDSDGGYWKVGYSVSNGDVTLDDTNRKQVKRYWIWA